MHLPHLYISSWKNASHTSDLTSKKLFASFLQQGTFGYWMHIVKNLVTEESLVLVIGRQETTRPHTSSRKALSRIVLYCILLNYSLRHFIHHREAQSSWYIITIHSHFPPAMGHCHLCLFSWWELKSFLMKSLNRYLYNSLFFIVNKMLGSNKTWKNIKCIAVSIKSQGGTCTLNHVFQKMFLTLNR